MPSYNYKCKKCEHVWEEYHGMNAGGPVDCPTCGEHIIYKLMNTRALHNKSGRYSDTISNILKNAGKVEDLEKKL